MLKDYDDQRHTKKRGGSWVRVSLDANEVDINDPTTPESPEMPAVMTALESLQKFDGRKWEVVVLRVFWGLTTAEIAEALNAGHATVERDWSFARAWLGKELAGEGI